MTILKPQPAMTIAAVCVLSLFSAASLAAGRAASAPGTMRAGAQRDVAAAHMTARPMASTTTTTATRPASATTTKSTTTAKSSTTTRRTGQPNASCEDMPNQPGHSISAPGSAFNPDGVSGTKYAGEQPQNSKNPKSVSQYDVACARPQH